MTTKKRKFVEPEVTTTKRCCLVTVACRDGEIFRLYSPWPLAITRKRDHENLLKLARKGYAK